MAKRKGPTLTARMGVVEYAVRRLQEQQERHALKLHELDRRLHEVERKIERHGWNDAESSAFSPGMFEQVRELSRELGVYRRLTGMRRDT